MASDGRRVRDSAHVDRAGNRAIRATSAIGIGEPASAHRIVKSRTCGIEQCDRLSGGKAGRDAIERNRLPDFEFSENTRLSQLNGLRRTCRGICSLAEGTDIGAVTVVGFTAE